MPVRNVGERAGLGLFLAIASGALLFAIAAGTGIGEMAIPLETTFAAVTNKLGWTATELSPIQESVIWDYRLSRALVAACCGAGLAISGAVLQSLETAVVSDLDQSVLPAEALVVGPAYEKNPWVFRNGRAPERFKTAECPV